jgi:hypothetical protein
LEGAKLKNMTRSHISLSYSGYVPYMTHGNDVCLHRERNGTSLVVA